MLRPKGSKQVHRHRKLQSFPSDSGSCGGGVAHEDSNSFQLGWRSSKQPFGTPVKKLLAEEMSRETESKRRPPGVIARLMGLDGLPLQLPAIKHHKVLSENNLKRTTLVGKTRSSGTIYGSRSSRRSSKNQQEFKDVFEVSEIPNVESCRYSSQGSVHLKITDDEMLFIEQRFMDAKRLATYQDLQSSQDSHDTLEILDSNNDHLQKYFKRPDSLFEKHLDDLQAAPLQPHSGHVEAMKSLDIEKCEHGGFSWKLDRETTGLNYNRSHHKHHDGYSCRSARRHAMHSSPKSSKLQFNGRDKPDAVPTKIVVLKPNLGKMQNAAKIDSSPCSSHTFLLGCGKNVEFSDVRFSRDIELNQKQKLPDTAWHSRQNSLESREIAKEITSQMKNNLNNGSMIFSSSRFEGYTWDDSSCSFSGNESPEESEISPATLGKSFDMSNLPPSHFSESSVSREAKKRLSERWKMTLKSQQSQSISRSSTLAEMLAVPDKEMKRTNYDSISCGEGLRDKLARNGKPSGWVEPLGISSRDGWKDGCIGSLPRSKSLPASSTTFGSPRTILRHEALRDDRFMMPKETFKRERKKAVKCLDQRQRMNTRSSKSGHKKSWSSHSSNIGEDESSPDLNTIQHKMKIYLEEDLSKQEVLAAEILRDSSTEDVMDVANEIADGLSDSSKKELSVGSSSRNSFPVQPPVPGLESSCCKDVDQPSPVSVLEPSFTDDSSPYSECFESLNVDIQGLRMQLQLLKLESEEYVEGSVLTPSDEDGGEASNGISEDNGLGKTEDSWESSYMIDVLSESGIDRAQPGAFLELWHSPECPVSLSVFDELEKRYSDCTTCPSSERRLLFDRINSGIINIYEQFMSAQPWVGPTTATNICTKLIKNGLQDSLYKMLGCQGKLKDTALGKVLVSELQWLNLRDDVDVIAREVERLLLDDLVTEIAST
ncbi:uncharacterized protein LOC113863200 [Abrus precatorius]|uniref:Uncharacterized protein LOC113863200 n=1 Tax=Abrus precatorius TaxID=3816 RepID=A0A8B8L8E6_ABRPR|nr:uncharacterized protein LOC113863200 [Abrus precatorius]